MEEEVQEFIEKVEEMLALVSEGGAEFLDGAADVTPFLKLIKPTIDICDHIRLKFMLFGLRNKGNFKKKLSQLEKYVSTLRRAEYVVSSFRQALLSNSHIVNTIIGLQLSKLTDKDADVTQMDMVIFDALSSFNDFDVRNYKLIYEETDRAPFQTEDGSCVNIPLLNEREDFEGLSLTLSKSEKAGLFTYLPGACYEEDGGTVTAMGSFYQLNRASGLFYEMICEAESLLDETESFKS